MGPTPTTANAGYFSRLRDGCPHGNAYEADGGEVGGQGGDCASGVAADQPGVCVEDALVRRG